MNQTEAGRLAELASFDVLDTASEPAFDALVQAAAEIAECPTALVSLLDADRQWFKARVGMGADDTAREVSREIAFCDYVLRTDAALVVPDATLDARFADNPFVVELGGPRFYAGFPLRTDTGAVIGTLCVVDVDSRPAGLTARQQSMLELLSNQAMVLLELRRALRTRDAALQESALSERRYRALIEASSDVVSRHAPDGTTRYVSPSIRDVLGADPELELGVVAADRVHPQDAARMVEAVGVALAGTEASAVVRCRHADGSWRTLEIRLAPVRDDSGDVVELHSVSRDVSEQQASARRLQQLADELDEAHQEAIQRNVLISTVLDTVDVGIVACDGQGRLTLFNRATRDFHGLPADADLDPEQWADRYALYREDGSTLLAADEVPLLRALREGAVADLDIVIAPAGLPPRLVRCTGRALRDADGTLLGAVLAMADITASRAAARELAEQAEFTGVLLESAHSAMWACDLEGQLTYVNPGARQLLAWPAEASLEELVASGELAVRREAVRAYDPGGRALAPEEHPLARALVEGDVREVELVLRSGGLAPRTVLVGASAIHDADGKVRGAVATAHDVTELRASEQRFRTAFRDGPTPTARLDDDGTVREINAALRRLLAVRSLRLVGSSLIEHAHPQDRGRLAVALSGPGTGSEPVEVRFVRSDRRYVWCEVACSRSIGPDGQVLVLVQLLDVDGRKAYEGTLELAARRDALTGLANRSRLLTVLESELAGLGPRQVGLLYIDLDGFKAVNDTHGHEAGDVVLVEVAKRLTSCVRPADTVARLGGDEFVVLCPLDDGAPTGALDSLALRLERALSVVMHHRGDPVAVSGSVGVAVAGAGTTPEALLEAADQAMYLRKRERRTAATVTLVPAFEAS